MLPDYQLLDAAKHNDMELAREALARGANVNARDLDGFPPLYLAVTRGHMPLAEFLLAHDADLNAAIGKRKQTLLHWAAEHGSFGIVTFCNANRADINAQQVDGATPLLLAAKGGNRYVVELLLKKNALLSPRTSSQATARSVAERNGHYDIVKLIDAAADTRPSHLQAAEDQFQSRSGERTLF